MTPTRRDLIALGAGMAGGAALARFAGLEGGQGGGGTGGGGTIYVAWASRPIDAPNTGVFGTAFPAPAASFP